MINEEEEYQPGTCITAAELRAMGIAVPASIPNCGWVPRSAMVVVEDVDVTMDGHTVRCRARICFTAPFRWIKIDVTIENEGER